MPGFMWYFLVAALFMLVIILAVPSDGHVPDAQSQNFVAERVLARR